LLERIGHGDVKCDGHVFDASINALVKRLQTA
jgi:hypothetical protein